MQYDVIMPYTPPRLNDQIAFRVTSSERKKIERAASVARQRLSDFARDVILAEADRRLGTPTVEATLFSEE